MSKRRRKLPQIERPFHTTATQPARLPPEPEKTKRQQRIDEESKARFGFLFTLVLMVVVIYVDSVLMNAFTPRLYKAHTYDFRLALFAVCAFLFAESKWRAGHQSSGSWVFRRSYWHYEKRIHHRKVSPYRVLLRTYAFIFGVHLVALMMLNLNLKGLLDPEVALYTSVAIGIGIGIQAALAVLRYAFARIRDYLIPLDESQYAVGDDGEIVNFAAQDDSHYVLNADGEIEKVKRNG